MEVSVSAIQPLWEEAFGDDERPELYASNTPDEEGFLPLNDPQDFVSDITNMSHQQLHASGANNQLAMKLAQDEFMMISKLIMEINGKDSIKDPQAMKKPEVFEEIKESRLYGYKYERNKPALLNRSEDDISEREKEDVRLFQEPFEQGGFVPTERQYKSILLNAKDPSNPDGWKPIERDGKLLIPRQQVHHEEYVRHARNYHREEKDPARPGTASSLESSATPSKPANRQLARTRFGGQKVPVTRDASEDPSATSTPRGRRPNTPRTNGLSVLVSGRSKDNHVTKRRRLHSEPQSRQSHSLFRPQHPVNRTNTGLSSSDILSQGMSPPSLRRRKWTTEELVEAVKLDHTWLTDDPAQSEHWKEKILNSQYPVRTFSMFKKWSFWKQENRDKRPRNRKDGEGKPGKTKNSSIEVTHEKEEAKDVVNQEPGEMLLQTGDENKDENEGDDLPKEEIGLGIDGLQLQLPHDSNAKEEDFEAGVDRAVINQIVEEPQSLTEEIDEVKVEDSFEDPEDTIVAKTDSRPMTPISAPHLHPAVSRRLLRSSRRPTG